VSSWSLDPLLVWGLYLRGVGLVLFISFLSLSGQVVLGAGKTAGIGSVARRMAQIRDDFPSWKRHVYFPTLLWVSSSDAVLRVLPLIGLAASGVVIYGGPLSTWALALCYVCYLSLDLPMGLIFPWDCLLFESTVLSLFLPATHALPDFTAVAAPAPALTWAYRLLVFRVMFGFGKQKFLGSRPKDTAYLRGFLMYQPLLSPLAWYAHKLPLALLKGGVLFMFIAEIPVPFFAFFPGIPSLICALMTASLMVGIQLMGNFGYFSLITIVGCLPLLDSITPRTLELSQLFAAGAPMITNAFVIVHTLSTSAVFLFSSWLGQSWSLWSVWFRLPRAFQPLLTFFRVLHPFRWLHPYGVFPPNNQPGVKISLLPEVSWDGKTWHELQFKYAPTNERSQAYFVAPHHPRGDQAIIYDTFGLNANSLMSGMLGPWDPYYYAASAPAFEFCQKLLETNKIELAKTEVSKQHTTPPRAARITTIMLEPTSFEQRKQTGKSWKRTYIGPHVPTHEYDPDFWHDAFGEPELWHFEAIMWRQRSRFKELMDRSVAGKDDPLELAIWDGRLSAQEVETFWNELVPLVSMADRSTFETVPGVVDQVRTRFDRRERRSLARLLGRFSLILVARLEPLYLYRGGKPLIPAQTYLHLWMLAHHIIAQGKSVYLHALEHPESWSKHLAAMTNQSGLFLLSVFKFEEMCFEAQKLRLINSVVHPHDPAAKRVIAEKLRNASLESLPKVERLMIGLVRTISGYFCVMSDIRDSFIGPAYDQGFPELYPTFEELDSGEIRLKSYAYPKPGEALAPDLKSLPKPPVAETNQAASSVDS
jgi:hypothetical protein